MDAVAARRDRLDARAVGMMVVLCALWGLQQVTVKLAVAGGLPPVLQAAIRSIVASALVVAWTAWREGRRGGVALMRVDATLWPGLCLGASFTAEFACFYAGVGLTSASRGVLFMYTAPFFTALAAHVLLPDDRLTRRKSAALLIAFAGVTAAFAQGLRGGQGSIRGDLLCVAGAVFWAISTIIIKANPALARARSAKVLLYQIGVSIPFLLAISLGAGEWSRVSAPTALAWLCLFYQSVVVAFATYMVWFWMVLAYPATRLAPFTFLAPVFGIGFGGLLLGEPVGPGLLAGIVAIGVGLRLLNSRAA